MGVNVQKPLCYAGGLFYSKVLTMAWVSVMICTNTELN